MMSATKKVKEVIGLIDRSGSMGGKEIVTINGINTMLTELKQNADPEWEIRVSIKYFDDTETLFWKSIPLESVTLLDIDSYVPDGQTALLDSLGKTLQYFMQKYLKNNNAYDSCIIYIATDGLDTCSNIYSKANLKKMINTAKEKYNIEVIYLGANQDAIEEASTIGIPETQAINYSEDNESTQSVYRAVARMASSTERTNTTDFGFTYSERSRSNNK
jgi:uncharacterized protein YegL